MVGEFYLDNAAATKVAEEVLDEMLPYFSKKYGNASSLHKLGREAKKAIEDAREKIAEHINCKKEEIIFTASGTEADNLAIKGLALAYPEKKHIITSKIEHAAVLETCKFLEKQGYEVDYIGVDKNGIVKIEDVKKAIREDTLIVSIMHVNNEIGTIQPIEEIAEICRSNEVFFHTDAVQSFGKLKIDARNFDLLSASGHKINGPKGIGLLYVRDGVKIVPLLHGGGHERGLRSGTENVPGIVGMAKAVELADKIDKKEIKKIRDSIFEKLLEINGVRINGSREKRIYNNINISVRGIEGESLLMMLDRKKLFASTGSACSSHSLKGSHVLSALGIGEEEIHSSLRITLGNDFKEKNINRVICIIKDSINKLRKISPF